jgi:hypothetical protein
MAEERELTGDRIREAASESVREGAGIRARMHDLTLAALRGRRFDRGAIREVVRAVAEGATRGAETSRKDARLALAEAFQGLDEALSRSAEAGRAALRQLAATGRSFSEQELKQALAGMRKIEEDFFATWGQVAESASERVRPELRRVLDEARKSGTETGRLVGATLSEFAARVSSGSIEAALAGMEAAAEFGARFALAASGILGGIATALRESEAKNKS